MNINEYFPLGIAKGSAFFNRDKERSTLYNSIKAGNDIFIISPRRYGKTSLILKVLEEIKIIYKEIDLYTARDSYEIENIIVTGIFEIVKKIIPKHNQIINLIKEYFKNIKVKVVLNSEGLSFEFEKANIPGVNILEALSGLDKVLIQKKTRIVLFIDEFQQVGKLGNSTPIEGAIRHVAQKSDNIIFIFSGSNRHILNSMIDDRSKPLYKLCNRFTVERMEKEHINEHILEASSILWGSPFPQKTIDKILELTELHPYYLNALCNNLFITLSSKIPSEEDVLKVWNDYVVQEKSNTAREIEALNHSQYLLLKHIAKGTNKLLTGKDSLNALQLSINAVRTALIKLGEKDLIYKNSANEYVVLDPLIKTSLTLNFQHGA